MVDKVLLVSQVITWSVSTIDGTNLVIVFQRDQALQALCWCFTTLKNPRCPRPIAQVMKPRMKPAFSCSVVTLLHINFGNWTPTILKYHKQTKDGTKQQELKKHVEKHGIRNGMDWNMSDKRTVLPVTSTTDKYQHSCVYWCGAGAQQQDHVNKVLWSNSSIQVKAEYIITPFHQSNELQQEHPIIGEYNKWIEILADRSEHETKLSLIWNLKGEANSNIGYHPMVTTSQSIRLWWSHCRDTIPMAWA